MIKVVQAPAKDSTEYLRNVLTTFLGRPLSSMTAREMTAYESACLRAARQSDMEMLVWAESRGAVTRLRAQAVAELGSHTGADMGPMERAAAEHGSSIGAGNAAAVVEMANFPDQTATHDPAAIYAENGSSTLDNNCTDRIWLPPDVEAKIQQALDAQALALRAQAEAEFAKASNAPESEQALAIEKAKREANKAKKASQKMRNNAGKFKKLQL